MLKHILIKLCLAGASWLLIPVLARAAEPIRLATFEYPPYITQKGDQVTGIATDIVTQAFDRAHIPLKIESYPLLRALRMLNTGLVDGFYSIKKTPEREKSLLFLRSPLFHQDYVFFVPNYSRLQFNGDLASMSNVRIGIIYSTSYGGRFDTAVKDGVLRQLDPAENYSQVFIKLLAGRVDAVICSKLVGLEILKKLGAANQVKISGPPVETTFSYLAFTQNMPYQAKVAALDKVLDQMNKDGTIKRIFQHYGY